MAKRIVKNLERDQNYDLIDELVDLLSFRKDLQSYVYLFSPGRTRGFRKVKVLEVSRGKITYLPVGEKKWVRQDLKFFPIIERLKPFRILWEDYMKECNRGRITDFHEDYFRKRLYEKAKECLK